MKDRFSIHSDQYARYRPSYPASVFEYLDTLIKNKNKVWDCGTGSGQAAIELAKTFKQVFATDISEKQLENASKAENINYSLQAAEKTNFPEDFFDLIVAAQAIHWFNFEAFYAEVKRTANENACICVLGYGKVRISSEIDAVINHFYEKIVGPYWDEERRYIDENYRTIPFPFEELQVPKFESIMQWDLDHFLGYIGTWSAVRKFISQEGFSPLGQLQSELESLWYKSTKKEVRFPILLRIGKIR